VTKIKIDFKQIFCRQERYQNTLRLDFNLKLLYITIMKIFMNLMLLVTSDSIAEYRVPGYSTFLTLFRVLEFSSNWPEYSSIINNKCFPVNHHILNFLRVSRPNDFLIKILIKDLQTHLSF
jgi:hypothetical protein